jgi:hypothetical protein
MAIGMTMNHLVITNHQGKDALAAKIDLLERKSLAEKTGVAALQTIPDEEIVSHQTNFIRSGLDSI